MTRSLLERSLSGPLLNAYWQFRRKQLRRRLQGLSAKEVFTLIYSERLWGKSPENGEEFFSGSGSHNPFIVEGYIATIAKWISTLGGKVDAVDLACGYCASDRIRARLSIHECPRFAHRCDTPSWRPLRRGTEAVLIRSAKSLAAAGYRLVICRRNNCIDSALDRGTGFLFDLNDTSGLRGHLLRHPWDEPAEPWPRNGFSATSYDQKFMAVVDALLK